jgi:two-component sensor histidine kinase
VPAARTIPADEAKRIAAVRRYDILDTPPDGAFDRITALAARRFRVPIAIISIVDEDRIWFKSHHGLTVKQIGRDPGLCASAILADDPYILPDASVDPRSLTNPLVAGEFGLRFYAAVPLVTGDGFKLGTLCVIDRQPRPVDAQEIEDLKDLASVVMDQIELQLSARRAVTQAQLMAKEIEHRVMNSLQFVSGMLTMQSRALEIGDASEQLQLAANRVAAMSKVHRHSLAEVGSETSCLGFLRRLCADISTIVGRPIGVEGDEGTVPTYSLQPIGLLVNELVTNAAKHGAGKIEVSYRTSEGLCRIVVCDEGRGLPSSFDPEAVRSSLGMRIVVSLAGQLKGRLQAESRPNGGGACFTVEFPQPGAQQNALTG